AGGAVAGGRAQRERGQVGAGGVQAVEGGADVLQPSGGRAGGAGVRWVAEERGPVGARWLLRGERSGPGHVGIARPRDSRADQSGGGAEVRVPVPGLVGAARSPGGWVGGDAARAL